MYTHILNWNLHDFTAAFLNALNHLIWDLNFLQFLTKIVQISNYYNFNGWFIEELSIFLDWWTEKLLSVQFLMRKNPSWMAGKWPHDTQKTKNYGICCFSAISKFTIFSPWKCVNFDFFSITVLMTMIRKYGMGEFGVLYAYHGMLSAVFGCFG